MKKTGCLGGGFSIDFLAHPVGFNVRGQPVYRTKVGSVLSLACIALFVTLSWVTIANYLDTSRPVISYESLSLKTKPKINIKQSRLYPIIFFYDQVNYLDAAEAAKYVNPYIMYYKADAKGAPKLLELKLVPCKDLIARGKTDTISVEGEGLVKTNYQQYGHCVDDEEHQVTLGGEDVQGGIELFSIGLYPCILPDGSCKPLASLGRLAISVSFPSALSNYGDYKSPIKYVTESGEFVGLSNSMMLVNYHNLRVNDVMQERGFLSKLETTHSFVSIEKSTSQIRARDSSQTSCTKETFDYCMPYILHNFVITNNKLKVVRSYKGIVESISEIGGMIDLIYLVFGLVYSIYYNTAVKTYFVKEVYGIEKPVSRGTLCCKKSKSDVTSTRSENQSEQRDLFKKALDRLHKDLDMLKLLEELNNIKYFLVSKQGMTAEARGITRSKTFKGLEDFELKQSEHREDEDEGDGDKLPNKILYQQSLETQQLGSAQKESRKSIFSKAISISSPHSANSKSRLSMKTKKSLFNPSKTSGQNPFQKASLEEGDFNSQQQLQKRGSFDEQDN
jgi:hypothetical protein